MAVEHINHMLSYLGGGKCDSVDVSDLLLDPGRASDELSSSMSRMRKLVAFQLCQCYWRRVRPHLVVESCAMLTPDMDIDECISKIASDEGKMDYWQRFVDANRFIFSLNAHLLSEAHKRNFAVLAQRIDELTQQQLSGYQLAQEEFKLASQMEVKTGALLQSVDRLSAKLSPITDLSDRLPKLLRGSSQLLSDILAQNTEMEDTVGILLLILVYLFSYMALHFSTAMCFGGTNVFLWTRRLMVVAMLADWVLQTSRHWSLTFLIIVSCFPSSIACALAATALKKRLKHKKRQEEEIIEQEEEDQWEYARQWFEAFIHRRASDAKKLAIADGREDVEHLYSTELLEDANEHPQQQVKKSGIDEESSQTRRSSSTATFNSISSPRARKRKRNAL